MKYCPKCKYEYRDDITMCSDCKVELEEVIIEETKNKERVEVVAMRPVKVASVSNQVEAGMLMELLHNNGIASMVKDIGGGGYMDIYMGFTAFGKDIYVDESDVMAAKQLVDEVWSATESTENEQVDVIENEEENVQQHKGTGAQWKLFKRVVNIIVYLYLLVFVMKKIIDFIL